MQDKNRNQLVLTFALVGLILSLGIGYKQQSATAQSAKNTAESPIIEIQAPEPSKVSPNTAPDANNISPRISFEKTGEHYLQKSNTALSIKTKEG